MGSLLFLLYRPPTEYDEKTRKKRWKEDSAVQLGEFIEQLRAVSRST